MSETIVVVLSDMHSGGTTALFPNRFMQFKHINHTPTPKQKTIFNHFDKCAKAIAERRRGRRMVLIHDGDAIEGWHHNSQEIITANKAEQREIHEELMDHFLRRVGFKKSADELYYINGTETHTGEHENEIAKSMGAKKPPYAGHVWDHLELKINRRLLWFAHHGKGRGKGPNEGSGLRLFLRDVYYDCLKRSLPPPDMVITGHTHTPTYNTFIVREGGDFRTLHGIIAPSWQMKTRYAYKASPVDVNEIGSVDFDISEAGEISRPRFQILGT